jgi:hypothetical protein
MAEKVKLSKDGNSIDFVQSESIPTSVKKFRQSPEIEGFYRFIFENDLQKETYEILERIVNERKAKKKAEKAESMPVKVPVVKVETKKPAPVVLKKAEVAPAKKAAPVAVTKAVKPAAKPVVKAAAKPAPKKAAPPAKKAAPAKAPAKKPAKKK